MLPKAMFFALFFVAYFSPQIFSLLGGIHADKDSLSALFAILQFAQVRVYTYLIIHYYLNNSTRDSHKGVALLGSYIIIEVYFMKGINFQFNRFKFFF